MASCRGGQGPRGLGAAPWPASHCRPRWCSNSRPARTPRSRISPNISATADNVFYLSNDLRVFTVTPGVSATPIAGVPWPGTSFSGSTFDTASAFSYLKSLLNTLNGNSSYNSGATDPFTLFPDQSSALTGDSSVTPYAINPASPLGTPFNNYNFAIARVRLTGTPGASTGTNVRVFFRLFATETSDTDYQTDWTYPYTPDSAGNPGAPSLGIGNVTIPFFARPFACLHAIPRLNATILPAFPSKNALGCATLWPKEICHDQHRCSRPH